MNVLYILLRILRQFSRDRRTLALILLVPLFIMALFFLLFQTEQQTRLRLGVYFGEPGSRVAKGIREALAELQAVQPIMLAEPDLERAIDGSRLDAAVGFSEALQGEMLSQRTVSYELVLEGTKPNMRAAVQNIVQAATLDGLRRKLPLPIPTFTFRSDVRYRYASEEFRFIDLVSPAFIAFFLYFISFLLTCVAFLRERSSGTLERLFVSPVRSLELLLGYLLAFFLISAVQSSILLLFSIYVLRIRTAANILLSLVPIMLTVLLGVTMGIFFSTLARNEFQVIQFIPIVIIPQVLLSGTIFEIESVPRGLRWLSYGLPLTYTNEILKNVLLRGKFLLEMWRDFVILGGFFLLFFLLSLAVVRRIR